MGTVSVTTTYKVKCKFCGTENLEWHYNPITQKYWLGDSEDHLHRCVRGVSVKVGTPVPKRPKIGKYDPISREVMQEDRRKVELENVDTRPMSVSVRPRNVPCALSDAPVKGKVIPFNDPRKK